MAVNVRLSESLVSTTPWSNIVRWRFRPSTDWPLSEMRQDPNRRSLDRTVG